MTITCPHCLQKARIAAQQPEQGKNYRRPLLQLPKPRLRRSLRYAIGVRTLGQSAGHQHPTTRRQFDRHFVENRESGVVERIRLTAIFAMLENSRLMEGR